MLMSLIEMFNVKLAHSSLGYREDIFVTHLIITIKLDLSIFPMVVILFCGCVPEVVVPLHVIGFI